MVDVSADTGIDLGKAANFPYATIDPEEARIPVPDARFEWLCETYKPASRVPAFLTCIDIAGLTAVRLFSITTIYQYVYCLYVAVRAPRQGQGSATRSCRMSVQSMEFFRSSVHSMMQR